MMVILHILHGYDIQLATKLKAAFKAMFLANPQEHNIYGVAREVAFSIVRSNEDINRGGLNQDIVIYRYGYGTNEESLPPQMLVPLMQIAGNPSCSSILPATIKPPFR